MAGLEAVLHAPKLWVPEPLELRDGAVFDEIVAFGGLRLPAGKL